MTFKENSLILSTACAWKVKRSGGFGHCARLNTWQPLLQLQHPWKLSHGIKEPSQGDVDCGSSKGLEAKHIALIWPKYSKVTRGIAFVTRAEVPSARCPSLGHGKWSPDDRRANTWLPGDILVQKLNELDLGLWVSWFYIYGLWETKERYLGMVPECIYSILSMWEFRWSPDLIVGLSAISIDWPGIVVNGSASWKIPLIQAISFESSTLIDGQLWSTIRKPSVSNYPPLINHHLAMSHTQTLEERHSATIACPWSAWSCDLRGNSDCRIVHTLRWAVHEKGSCDMCNG